MERLPDERQPTVTERALHVLRRLETDDEPGLGAGGRRPAGLFSTMGTPARWAMLGAGIVLAVALGIAKNAQREPTPPPTVQPTPASEAPPEAQAARTELPPATQPPRIEPVPDVTAPPPFPQEPVPDRPEPPRIVGQSPRSTTVSIPAGREQRFEVAARAAHGEGPLAYTWILDGKVLGTGPEPVRTLPGRPPGEYQLRVVVRDSAGLATDPVEWRLVVRPPKPRPPAIVRHEPSTRKPLRVQEDGTLALRVAARDPDDGGPLAYRWLVDGNEVGREPVFRFRAEEPAGTRKTIEARVRDAGGLEAAPLRWQVEITPRLREAEALAWVERFQSAWYRRDLGTFRLYGLGRSQAEARALRAQLARQRRYRVQFSPGRARVSGRYGSVSFVRQEVDGGRVVSSVVETYQIEKHPSGLVTLRGVPPP